MVPPCRCAGSAGALEIVSLLFDNRTNDRLPSNKVYRVAGRQVKKKHQLNAVPLL
jgi:hypothetical protein